MFNRQEITKEELYEHYQIPWESEWLKQVDSELYPLSKLYRNRMLATMEMIDAGRDEPIHILDVGCGVGIYDFNILRRFPRAIITAVDLSQPQVEMAAEIAKQKNFSERITFMAGDVEDLQIDGRFDYILCTEVLEHLPDPGKALNTLSSLCGAKKKVIVSVPQLYNGAKQEGIFYRQVAPDGRVIHTLKKDKIDFSREYFSYYHTYYDEKKLADLLQSFGLNIEKKVGVNLSIARDYSVTNDFFRVLLRKMNNLASLLISRMTSLNSYRMDILLNKMTGYRFGGSIIVRCRKEY